MTDKNTNKILVLDFGAPSTSRITEIIEGFGISCKIFPWDISKLDLNKYNPQGVILSGGPKSVLQANSPYVHDYVLNYGVPILGICYGMQTMADKLGGSVVKAPVHEFEETIVRIYHNNVLFSGLDVKSKVTMWMNHDDQLLKLPQGFINLARTTTCPYAAIANSAKKFYGVQFHPEVDTQGTQSSAGTILLKNFVEKICLCNA